MSPSPMVEAEFQALVARLRAGERIPHAEHLPLYADTRVGRSELSADGEGFVWTTYFSEHAPGHGWSCEMKETRWLDEAALRHLLRG